MRIDLNDSNKEKNNPAALSTKSHGRIQAGVDSESIAPGWKTVLPYGKKDETDAFYNRDIFVKALVIRVGMLEVALVEADVIGIVFEEAQMIKARITQESGIPGENIILGAVHNHSYPRLKDPKILEFVAKQSALAVKNARANMFPAMIGATKRTMPENLSINRSWTSGPVNSELSLIRIDDTAGYTRAVIFNCGIHPTCFTTSWGDDKTGMIGPEWPEYVRRQISFQLQSHYDYDRRDAGMPYENIFAMFTLGVAGDQQAALWLDETGGRKMPVLRAFVDTIAGEILNMVDWVVTKSFAEMTFSRKSLIIDILSRDRVRGERETLLQFLSINDIALITVPGELVYNFGKEFARISPFKYTMPITCANDYLPGYIVSEGESREAATFESKDWDNRPELGTIIMNAAAGFFGHAAFNTSAGIEEVIQFGSVSGTVICESRHRFVAGVMNKIEEPSANPPFWGKRAEVGSDGVYFIDQLLPGIKYFYIKEVTDNYSSQADQDIGTITYGMPVEVFPGRTTEVSFEFPAGLYHTEVTGIEINSIDFETNDIRTGGAIKNDLSTSNVITSDISTCDDITSDDNIVDDNTVKVNKSDDSAFNTDSLTSGIRGGKSKILGKVHKTGQMHITGRVHISGTLMDDERIEARLYYAGIARHLSFSGSLRKSAYPEEAVAFTIVDKDGSFSFKDVSPGVYVAGCWLDVNRNGRIEPGVDIVSKLSKPIIVE
ncbi:MAG: hypothetical protein Q7J78_03070 [Clostridiales bacterium]|nr:hypothetical protein [Clostridiales bacterium]